MISTTNTESQPKALHRGLDVLELIARDGSLAFHELQGRVAIPPASFARILAALVERGCLAKGADGRYRLGLDLARLAQSARDMHPLQQAAGDALRAVMKATDEAAELIAFEPGRFVFLDRCQSERAVVLRARPGATFDTRNESAIGQLAIAFGWSGEDTLPAARAKEIREAGFCERLQNHDEVYRGVAAILDGAGQCIGGLAVAAPAYRVGHEERQRFHDVLRKQAELISRNLGGG
jgi:DNA-binding IclR family transcriptional regulator